MAPSVASPWLCPLQHTLQVGQDSGRSVTCMVSSGTGVWVALQSSAQVRLYHATSYEQLAEADITPPVHKMLAGKCHQRAPAPSLSPVVPVAIVCRGDGMLCSSQCWEMWYLLHPGPWGNRTSPGWLHNPM